MSKDAEEQPSSAAQDWMRLYKAGEIGNVKALSKGAQFWLLELPLTLERIYLDGSILRWHDKQGRWRFYTDADSLAWAKKKGEA